MQLLWSYFRQIRGRDKDRAALPQMRGGDGILCDRRYCDGAGAEAVGKVEGKNGRYAEGEQVWNVKNLRKQCCSVLLAERQLKPRQKNLR